MRNSNNFFNKPEIYVFPTTKIPEFSGFSVYNDYAVRICKNSGFCTVHKLLRLTYGHMRFWQLWTLKGWSAAFSFGRNYKYDHF